MTKYISRQRLSNIEDKQLMKDIESLQKEAKEAVHDKEQLEQRLTNLESLIKLLIMAAGDSIEITPGHFDKLWKKDVEVETETIDEKHYMYKIKQPEKATA